MTGNPIIENYISAVRENIYGLVESERFIESLRQSIYDFADSADVISLQDLIDEFGSPEEVAEDYLSSKREANPTEVSRSNTKRNLLIAAAAVGVIVIVGLLIWAMRTPVDVPTFDETTQQWISG